MAFVPAPSPTVVDQTTLMKKYLQFVAALTDTNTRKLSFLTVLLDRNYVRRLSVFTDIYGIKCKWT